jgi:hypothetical protein
MKINHVLFICFLSIFAQAVIAEGALCPAQDSCADINNSCKCYCAHICEPRDKKPEQDNPVWVPNDPAGNYCYCKPWDYENYGKRCKAKAKGKTKGRVSE